MNINGVISFGNPFPNYNTRLFPLLTNDVLMAPFWDDQDHRGPGQVLYRFTEDASLLERVGTTISAAFATTFSPRLLFIATWDRAIGFIIFGVPREVA